MEIADFLLARFAEDEVEAKAQNSSFLRSHGPGALLSELDGYGLHWLASSVTTAAHVLAECEAKRRIVEMYQRFSAMPDDAGTDLVLDDVLRLIALPYADHPDYQQDWKP